MPPAVYLKQVAAMMEETPKWEPVVKPASALQLRAMQNEEVQGQMQQKVGRMSPMPLGKASI